MKNISTHLFTSLVILVLVGVTVLLINTPLFDFFYLAGITLFLGWLLVMWYQIIFGWITKYKEKRNKEVL
jgi:hypothetical protein